jgi:hypothetical protein
MAVFLNGVDTKIEEIAEEVEVVEQHGHPIFNVTVPNGSFRYGAITFASAADTETVTLTSGGVGYVYTFKTTLGSPAANNVHVKVQGSVAETVAMLAKAVRGVTDIVNIAYGTGTQPNPGFIGHYTGIRTSIGSAMHPASATTGPTIRLRDRYQDRDDATYPLTIADTTTQSGVWKQTQMIRTYSFRYTMTGNAAALGNRIAGCYHCIVPPYTVVDISGNYVKYDPSQFVVESISSNSMIVECDIYYSIDESSYTYVGMGLELSRDTASAGSQEYVTRLPRVTEGYGIYCKMRSNGNSTSDWIDCKVQIHTYNYGL